MSIDTASSMAKDPADAAAELAQKLPSSARLVIYFASTSYDPAALASALAGAFTDAKLIGCTSAGELVGDAMLKGSVVAMSLGADVIEQAAVTMARGIKEGDPIPGALAALESEIGVRMQDADPLSYVGLVLIDGLSLSEERVNERIGDLTNVHFVGGSAGDDLKFEKTFVMAGGEVADDAAVLALLKPAVPFEIIKTQSFDLLDKVLRATKVNEARREVIEFNDQPAARAYAEALGVPVDELPDRFMHNPLGLLSGDEIFVRSPLKLEGDSVIFYCQVLEGMELHLLEGTDIVADTGEAVEQKREMMNGISGLVNFHCILRTLELEKTDQCEPYGKLFQDVPSIGFSTYGESFIGHINQTSTMLVFR